MTPKHLPRYPVYVPSRDRFDKCTTANFLLKDQVPFRLVVEPQEVELYASKYGHENLLVLPHANRGLFNTRNWIKDHSIKEGHERHWQLDDNMMYTGRLYRGKRIPVHAGIALRVVEDFADRYTNVAIAGLQYEMFLVNGSPYPPFYLNGKVYSCSLMLNSIPHRWRLLYNDDTDLCLQVLADGWCTVLVNAFHVKKIKTMKVKGGNTNVLYEPQDGRLKMARALERVWPGVVTVARRWKRPQHVIKDAWRNFDTPLQLKQGIDFTNATPDEYGLKLKQSKPIRSVELQKIYDVFNKTNTYG